MPWILDELPILAVDSVCIADCTTLTPGAAMAKPTRLHFFWKKKLLYLSSSSTILLLLGACSALKVRLTVTLVEVRPMPVEFRPENTILFVEAKGTFSARDMQGLRSESAKMAEQQGLSKLLVDIRQTEILTTMTDIFEFMVSLEEAFPVETKHAVVYSPDTHDSSKARFGETVAANRSIPLRMFTDIDEARSWLLGGGNTS